MGSLHQLFVVHLESCSQQNILFVFLKSGNPAPDPHSSWKTVFSRRAFLQEPEQEKGMEGSVLGNQGWCGFPFRVLSSKGATCRLEAKLVQVIEEGSGSS